MQQLLKRRIREISHGVAAAYGVDFEVIYTHEFVPTVNDSECVTITRRAANRELGEDRVNVAAQPVMASEDFGVLARHVPACLAFLGNGTAHGAGGVPLHRHDYVFNDDILAAAVAYYCQVVTEGLAPAD